LVKNDVMHPLLFSRHTIEFLPRNGKNANRGRFSVLMTSQSPTDAVLPLWKKAGKQGKEMQKTEEEKKPAAAKITESTK